VPASLKYGRRPVFLITSFGFFATTIWSGAAQTLHSLAVARILGAFFAGTYEGLSAVIVADLFFLHERGWWMGVYMFFLANGTSLAIATGFLITAKGWRSLFWVLCVVQLVSLIGS
jgi:MFS family permease